LTNFGLAPRGDDDTPRAPAIFVTPSVAKNEIRQPGTCT
jgi:hypothetical protein